MNFRSKWFLLIIITLSLISSFANFSYADLVDQNIKSTMNIIQLDVQLNYIFNSIQFDRENYKGKIVCIPVSKDVAQNVSTKLNAIKSEVNFICKNLKDNKISPQILLSLINALKTNMHNTYHLYPFVECLKYQLLHDQIPTIIKKDIINFIGEMKSYYSLNDKTIYYVNGKKNPLAVAYIVGLAIGAGAASWVGYANYSNSNSIEHVDPNDEHDPVYVHEYAPYPWEYLGIGQ